MGECSMQSFASSTSRNDRNERTGTHLTQNQRREPRYENSHNNGYTKPYVSKFPIKDTKNI